MKKIKLIGYFFSLFFAISAIGFILCDIIHDEFLTIPFVWLDSFLIFIMKWLVLSLAAILSVKIFNWTHLDADFTVQEKQLSNG